MHEGCLFALLSFAPFLSEDMSKDVSLHPGGWNIPTTPDINGLEGWAGREGAQRDIKAI